MDRTRRQSTWPSPDPPRVNPRRFAPADSSLQGLHGPVGELLEPGVVADGIEAGVEARSSWGVIKAGRSSRSSRISTAASCSPTRTRIRARSSWRIDDAAPSRRGTMPGPARWAARPPERPPGSPTRRLPIPAAPRPRRRAAAGATRRQRSPPTSAAACGPSATGSRTVPGWPPGPCLGGLDTSPATPTVIRRGARGHDDGDRRKRVAVAPARPGVRLLQLSTRFASRLLSAHLRLRVAARVRTRIQAPSGSDCRCEPQASTLRTLLSLLLRPHTSI
jgi:hypothetical protein